MACYHKLIEKSISLCMLLIKTLIFPDPHKRWHIYRVTLSANNMWLMSLQKIHCLKAWTSPKSTTALPHTFTWLILIFLLITVILSYHTVHCRKWKLTSMSTCLNNDRIFQAYLIRKLVNPSLWKWGYFLVIYIYLPNFSPSLIGNLAVFLEKNQCIFAVELSRHFSCSDTDIEHKMSTVWPSTPTPEHPLSPFNS